MDAIDAGVGAPRANVSGGVAGEEDADGESDTSKAARVATNIVFSERHIICTKC